MMTLLAKFGSADEVCGHCSHLLQALEDKVICLKRPMSKHISGQKAGREKASGHLLDAL